MSISVAWHVVTPPPHSLAQQNFTNYQIGIEKLLFSAPSSDCDNIFSPLKNYLEELTLRWFHWFKNQPFQSLIVLKCGFSLELWNSFYANSPNWLDGSVHFLMLVVTVKQGKHWQCWLNTLFPFSQTLYFSLKPAAISKWDFEQQQNNVDGIESLHIRYCKWHLASRCASEI